MQFKEIVGQTKAKEGLITLFQSGRIPHALMLLGREGFGGLPLALAFAQYVFCENKQDNDSCGQCPACQKTEKLAHPDLHLTFPSITLKPGAKPSSRAFLPEFREFFRQTPYNSAYDWLQSINAENKQGNITAEECREIIEQLNLTSFEGGWKIQVIWRPEYLKNEGNILLKLIEEPPAHTLILFVAEQAENILKTILSRTQQILLHPLSTEEIAGALQENLKVDPRKARQVAHLAENNYARALHLLQFTGNDLLQPLRQWFNGIFTHNGILINEWVEEMAKNGREQQKNFLLYVQHILGHALRISLMAGYQPALLEDELNFARKLAGREFSPSVFQEMTDALAKTIFHIERNAHSKTQLLFLSLKLQYILKSQQNLLSPA